jgi:hypothetical protein
MQNELATFATPALTTSNQLTLLQEEIPVSETVTPGDTELEQRVLRLISSALLTHCALAWCSEKTLQLSARMLRGHGIDSAMSLRNAVMEFCPSAGERVALVSITVVNDCSCSPHFRTPTARDWKGMSAKSWRERKNGDKTPTLPDQIGGTPHPEFVEELMGFPAGWTDLGR